MTHRPAELFDQRVQGALAVAQLVNRALERAATGGIVLLQIGDVVVRRNTMRSPTGGLVFVFGGRGGARGPFVFEANRLQVTGAVTTAALE